MGPHATNRLGATKTPGSNADPTQVFSRVAVVGDFPIECRRQPTGIKDEVAQTEVAVHQTGAQRCWTIEFQPPYGEIKGGVWVPQGQVGINKRAQRIGGVREFDIREVGWGHAVDRRKGCGAVLHEPVSGHAPLRVAQNAAADCFARDPTTDREAALKGVGWVRRDDDLGHRDAVGGRAPDYLGFARAATGQAFQPFAVALEDKLMARLCLVNSVEAPGLAVGSRCQSLEVDDVDLAEFRLENLTKGGLQGLLGHHALCGDPAISAQTMNGRLLPCQGGPSGSHVPWDDLRCLTAWCDRTRPLACSPQAWLIGDVSMGLRTIVSPVDGSIYAERDAVTDTGFASLVDAARVAQRPWSALSIAERAAHCTAFVESAMQRTDAFAVEFAWQMGRPVQFGPGELRGFVERGHHMISIAAEALAPLTPGSGEDVGVSRTIAWEPLGVILCIAPWNYPLLTAVNTIVPALMAGNTLVLKHATQTMLVGERLAECAQEAGLPEGVFTHVVAEHHQIEQGLGAGWFDRVNFTGSVAGGRQIERAAAGSFTGVGLELGGKDPAYVRADANLSFAVEQIADGAFFNSGQSCCGIERVYAHSDVYDDVVAGLEEAAMAYQLGDPLDPETTLGPMVNVAAADSVRAQIDAAVAQGARRLLGPGRFAADTGVGSAYCSPEVVVDVDHSMAVMAEETFGPIVGVMAVKDDDSAVAMMNDSAYGLSASIWTRDLDAGAALGARVNAGTVFVNRADYLDPSLAWTGVKDSGRGATLSSVGYQHLTRPKSYYSRPMPELGS